MYYNNRRITAFPNIVLHNHFFLEVNGIRLCYCYIRKNASSSFKKLFMDYTPFNYSPDQYSRKIDFLRKKHGALAPLIRQECDATIVVFRDPIKRAISHFVNKIVAQTHAVDFSKNYKKITGTHPSDANFREFVINYLNNSWIKLDPHVWPQSKHLWPINYSHAVLDENLTSDMSKLLGDNITHEYFSGQINASERGKRRGIKNVLERPSRELSFLIGDYDINAELEEMATGNLGFKLKEIYQSDYEILQHLLR